VKAARALAALVLLGAGLAGCAAVDTTPRCEPTQRLGLLAQAVPSASYVPCIDDLPAGWSFHDLDVDDDGASFELRSDRSSRPVVVRFAETCPVEDAVPIPAQDPGVQALHDVDAIDPRVRGRLLDVFPGGCVEAAYDLERGPHVALFADLQRVLGLYPRIELRQRLADDLDLTLDP